MGRSTELLAGLIIVKDLEIKTLMERITQLQNQICILKYENEQLANVISEQQVELFTKEKQTKDIGFKQSG